MKRKPRKPLVTVSHIRDANRYRYLRGRGHLANFGKTNSEVDRAVDKARSPYK